MKIQTFELSTRPGRQEVPELPADAVMLNVVVFDRGFGTLGLRVSFATDDDFWKRSRQFMVLKDGDDDNTIQVGDAHHIGSVSTNFHTKMPTQKSINTQLHLFEVKYEVDAK